MWKQGDRLRISGPKRQVVAPAKFSHVRTGQKRTGGDEDNFYITTDLAPWNPARKPDVG
jgi:hypothetical protein